MSDPTDDDLDPLLRPAEVAAILRVSPKTVTRWAAEGMLPAVRTPGGHRRFRTGDIRALLDVSPSADTDLDQHHQ